VEVVVEESVSIRTAMGGGRGLLKGIEMLMG
jgi:hypothetical protein